MKNSKGQMFMCTAGASLHVFGQTSGQISTRGAKYVKE